jgi:hypothetical protein
VPSIQLPSSEYWGLQSSVARPGDSFRDRAAGCRQRPSKLVPQGIRVRSRDTRQMSDGSNKQVTSRKSRSCFLCAFCVFVSWSMPHAPRRQVNRSRNPEVRPEFSTICNVQCVLSLLACRWTGVVLGYSRPCGTALDWTCISPSCASRSKLAT